MKVYSSKVPLDGFCTIVNLLTCEQLPSKSRKMHFFDCSLKEVNFSDGVTFSFCDSDELLLVLACKETERMCQMSGRF